MESTTIEKAVEAYGGVKRWQDARYIEAEVSTTGLAFTLKRRPFFKHARLVMEIGRPFSKLTPIGKRSDISGVLEGPHVRLENKQGDIIAQRMNARDAFTLGRRTFYWDDLDMAYFANYAFWNYFTLPALLMNTTINWKEISEGILEAEFPDSIPTHSKNQKFHFDKKTGLLIQHNYTADIISRLAKAANVVMTHSKQDGIPFPASRRVTPRTLKGSPLKGPVLIDIQVHRYRLTG